MRKPKWVKSIEAGGGTYPAYCELQKQLAAAGVSLRHRGDEFIGGFFPADRTASYITFQWGLGTLLNNMANPGAAVAQCRRAAVEMASN